MRERFVDAKTPANPPTSSERASGSSFYHAMRILPQAQRDAMYEIYGFCRRVDDIADSSGPRPERLAQLAQWRAEINALYDGKVGALVTGLAEPVRTFDLAREDFLTVIDGMEMDTLADIRAPSLDMLDLYCDRVASAVGRLSVRVFGMERADGKLLSHHLGRALQLTNILRDLDEDAGVGRLYLPREALTAAGIDTTDPLTAVGSRALGQACAPLIERARGHFKEADAIMRRSPRQAVRAPRIMGEVYHAILEGMHARGFAPPRERVRVSRARLAWIIMRYALI
ncbi:MAG: presqualene diphosphate synthase [Alphaproteobacteria bacterium]|jgi:phytoene synthase|nr:presqualene diphosphate synthase [Alphaproteobacteria bacterium]